jgi:hypothetical protein
VLARLYLQSCSPHHEGHEAHEVVGAGFKPALSELFASFTLFVVDELKNKNPAALPASLRLDLEFVNHVLDPFHTAGDALDMFDLIRRSHRAVKRDDADVAVNLDTKQTGDLVARQSCLHCRNEVGIVNALSHGPVRTRAATGNGEYQKQNSQENLHLIAHPCIPRQENFAQSSIE